MGYVSCDVAEGMALDAVQKVFAEDSQFKYDRLHNKVLNEIHKLRAELNEFEFMVADINESSSDISASPETPVVVETPTGDEGIIEGNGTDEELGIDNDGQFELQHEGTEGTESVESSYPSFDSDERENDESSSSERSISFSTNTSIFDFSAYRTNSD
jgi:hypothetical protein